MNDEIIELLQRGEFDLAISELNNILAEDLENYDALLGVAIALLESGRLDEAKKALDYFHLNTDGTYDSYEALGVYYVRLEQPDEAEAYFLKAIELAPDNGNIRRNLAMVYLMQDREDEAEYQLKKAAELDPENYLTQVAVAQYHISQGELNVAEFILRGILEAPFDLPPDKAAFVSYLIEELEKLT